MENEYWSKSELQVYILLLCAQADNVETQEEISFIKSKATAATVEKMQHEIDGDTEDESLQKIQDNLAWHNYSPREIKELKKEMETIFLSDDKYLVKESSLSEILDNILF
jgi:hypothetical protein|tara:strand:+ start:5867 stop:6196 length:330 start_codon:yes stop_codon:yes gene_type:complete